MTLKKSLEFNLSSAAVIQGESFSYVTPAQAFTGNERGYAGYIEATIRSAQGVLTAEFQTSPLPDPNGIWKTLLSTSAIFNATSAIAYESQSILNRQALAPYGRVKFGLVSEAGTSGSRFDSILARFFTEDK